MRRHAARIPGYAETVRHMHRFELTSELDKLTHRFNCIGGRPLTVNSTANRRDIERRLKVLNAEVERRGLHPHGN